MTSYHFVRHAAMHNTPPEVLGYILGFLSSEYDSSPHDTMRGLAACSIASRALSDLARPYIFQRALITSPERAERLLSLIPMEPRITIWMKHLIIGQREIISDTLVRWFGSSAASEFISIFPRICDLSVYSVGGYKSDLDASELKQFWTNLGSIRLTTTLKLSSCQFLAPNDAIEFWTATYSCLTSLSIDHALPFFASETRSAQEWKTRSFPCPQMHRLRFSDCYSTHMNETLVGLLRCEALTDLDIMASSILWKGQIPSFSYIQGLLNHAPNLRYLTLDLHQHEWIYDPVQLGSSPRIECLSFRNVSRLNNYNFLAQVVSSLADQSRLLCLEVVGSLGFIQPEVWADLDDCISGPQFVSVTGGRSLHIRDSGQDWIDATNGSRIISAADAFPQAHKLGWFKVAWQA